MSAAVVQQVDASFSRLQATFASHVTHSFAWRMSQLRALERLLAERQADLVACLTADLDRSPSTARALDLLALEGDLALAIDNLKAWMADEWMAAPVPVQPGRLRIMKQPKGVVLIIAPWNYPVGLTLAPLVGALAAGCCVAIKPSEVAPATSRALAELLPQYLDKNAVHVLEGGVEITTELLKRRWDHILYTGNGTVGRIVMAAAAKHLTPVTLELGGKSPCIVAADADLPVACRRIIHGKTTNVGQTCIAPDYLFVHESVRDKVVEQLKVSMKAMFGDDALKSPDYSAIINSRHFGRLNSLLEKTKSEAQLAWGGRTDAARLRIELAVFTNVRPDAEIMKDEIFGPLLPIMTYRDISEAIDYINAHERPLSLYVFTQDAKLRERVLSETISGGCGVNDTIMHYTCHDLPFGGIGESGIGAYHGKASFETFTHRKSVLQRPTALDLPFRYPPYKPGLLLSTVFGLVNGKVMRPVVRAAKVLAFAGVVGAAAYAFHRMRQAGLF